MYVLGYLLQKPTKQKKSLNVTFTIWRDYLNKLLFAPYWVPSVVFLGESFFCLLRFSSSADSVLRERPPSIYPAGAGGAYFSSCLFPRMKSSSSCHPPISSFRGTNRPFRQKGALSILWALPSDSEGLILSGLRASPALHLLNGGVRHSFLKGI